MLRNFIYTIPPYRHPNNMVGDDNKNIEYLVL